MFIKELTLFTNTLEAEKQFYQENLGCQLLENAPTYFSVQIGLSKLIFCESTTPHRYHYCFLIPSNQLNDAIEWLKSRLTIVKIEGERLVQRFETWNADSIYFYDGSGNLAEFIVRYDLKNESQAKFDVSSVISVNEIGMPTKDVAGINAQLAKEMNSVLWKGDLKRFGTNGDQNGLFLLPNYEMKTEWFPTDLEVQSAPFKALILNDEKAYQVEYGKEVLKIKLE